MKKSTLVLLACVLFSFSTFAQIKNDEAEAKAQKLWQHPYWLKLLHYEKKLFGGYESQVDAQEFFLSAHGKTDPKSELLTNIERLLDEKSEANPNQHPACKFPLRYEWLREKLNVHTPDLVKSTCENFQSWVERLGATGLSLVFASSYTNNPASMFGHTLLRVHREKEGIDLPPLLNYTVNFAAETGQEKGFLYTMKGLFGAYPGKFSTFPYYQKIQQYSNWESRDIWEYKLQISPEELHKIVFHLWEMGSAYFDYYFVDENCSYFLLALLESANDEVQLRKYLPFFTIPVDTIKMVQNKTNWISEHEYRPSLQKKFKNRYEQLDDSQKKKFDQLLKSKKFESMLNDSKQSDAMILDAMIDYESMKEKQNTKTDFQKELLNTRSMLGIASIDPVIKKPGDPLDSHPTRRMGLGAIHLRGENFVHLDFRGAYHDLLDNPLGFDGSAQIQGMEGRIRVSTQNGDISLDHLKMIEVVSLSPLQEYSSKPSWNIGFGWRTNYSKECFHCGSFYLEGGPGITLGSYQNRRAYFTMFSNGFFQAGPWNKTDYQIGPSGTSLFLVDISNHLRLMLTGNMRYSPIGKPDFMYKIGSEISMDLSKHWSLRGWANKYSLSDEFGGTLLYYF